MTSTNTAGTFATTTPATREVASFWRDRWTVVTGTVLLLVAAGAWLSVVRQAAMMRQMDMTSPGGTGAISLVDATVFVAAWGVMMAAMMLPSALPMIALYRTVSHSLSRSGHQMVPTTLFAVTYLLVWLFFGVPVYAASAAVSIVSTAVPPAATWLPYALAVVLFATGAYQFTAFKRVCLQHCQTPFTFLMTRMSRTRGGYSYWSTLRLGLAHALYCVGCCWGLMVVLVAAGAMSLPWVLLISAVVFVEKLLPRGEWTARLVGGGLIALGLAVAVNPDLALLLRGHMMPLNQPMPKTSMPM